MADNSIPSHAQGYPKSGKNTCLLKLDNANYPWYLIRIEGRRRKVAFRKRSSCVAALGLACAVGLLGSAGSAWAGQPPEQPTIEACAGPGAPGGGQRVCGTLNPASNAKVGYYFAYNAGPNCTGGGQTVEGPEVEGEGIGVAEQLGGLAPSTQYSYCLVATNSFGETFSEAWTFRTVAGAGATATEAVSSSAATVAVGSASFLSPVNGALERTRKRLIAGMRACRAMPVKRRAKCRKRARRNYARARKRYE